MITGPPPYCEGGGVPLLLLTHWSYANGLMVWYCWQKSAGSDVMN